LIIQGLQKLSLHNRSVPLGKALVKYWQKNNLDPQQLEQQTGIENLINAFGVMKNPGSNVTQSNNQLTA
jgi:shikimate 5-dehydrogenase